METASDSGCTLATPKKPINSWGLWEYWLTVVLYAYCCTLCLLLYSMLTFVLYAYFYTLCLR